MSLVHVLPEDLANQIAAGEVVERPASVVKELLENALDAGARRIRVDIQTGGVDLVRVADDGSGMAREDAELAVLRHATSKLATVDDLAAIRSFGFRGEALPTIASVSRFELRTRRSGDAEGTLVRINGGGPAEIGPASSAAGTSVEVRDLFFNVPARRKFLKSTATESAKVTEVVESAALGEPAVTVILARDGKVVAEWLRAGSREERARSVFAGEELCTCVGERGPLRVEAYLSRPERARTGATWLHLFVNGRPVRDRTLARSVALAYGSVLESGRYPVGVAYLDLPFDLVDVNVHPQKAEVRFADARAVSDSLFKIVGTGVRTAFNLPGAGTYPGKKQKLFEDPAGPGASTWVFDTGPGVFDAPPPAQTTLPAAPPAQTTLPAASPDVGTLGNKPSPSPAARSDWHAPARLEDKASPQDAHWLTPPRAEIKTPSPSGNWVAPARLEDNPSPLPPPMAARPIEPAADPSPVPYPTAVELAAAAAQEKRVVFGALRFVAQVRSTFFVCEGADGLYLLDQHAAAERVTFHRLKKGFDAKEIASQKMLFPAIVTVTASEAALVEERQETIARTGLDVRVTGPTSVAVHAVPLLLVKASPERLLRDLLDEVSHAGERAFSGAIDRAIATMACHGSLRAGDPVAAEEARALLAALDDVDFAGHCPHGRPVVMRIGWGELEHRVGRK
ncbi:DNA mismatch repair protein MutL [Minicystis rosea]|nr:DNA mismatch repair protein MutL [Minicystis rosea]